MSTEPCFQLEMSESAEELPMIFFSDGFGWQELWASEINALLDLRMQVEIMMDQCQEMAFTDIVEQSVTLKERFEAVVKSLKLRPK